MLVATTTVSAVAVPRAVWTDTGWCPVTRRTRVPSTSVPPWERKSAAMAASSSMGRPGSARGADRPAGLERQLGVAVHATGSPASCAAASSARAEASPRWVTAKVYAARFCSATPWSSQ